MAKNVLGGTLQPCCKKINAGFYRDGFCNTGPTDYGRHVVCAKVTSDFLNYSKSQGNDLMTPRPEFHFPGLKPGDKWCLCASRWKEGADQGYAPDVVLESTHEKALEYIPLEMLKKYAAQEEKEDTFNDEL